MTGITSFTGAIRRSKTSQPKRRKLARGNQGRHKGVKCQGRRAGSGRSHR